MGRESWKDNFRMSNLFANHDNPQVFITSQWQFDKGTPSYIYLCLRLAIFVAFFVIWILTYTMETPEGKPRWPIFLTNWGMTLCMLQSFLASLMLACNILGTRIYDWPSLAEKSLNMYHTYWVINVMATNLAFTISLTYWSVIYAATGYYWSTMNFMVHGFNSILMFFDFCIVSHPIRLVHFLYPIFLTLSYLTMTVVFYACGGTTKDGSRAIYPILKWDTPTLTVGYCLVIMIVMVLLHIATFFLYVARTKIAKLIFGDNDNESIADQEEEMIYT